MRESEIQAAITRKLKAAGWEVIKLIQTTANGIPDLMALKEGRAVFIEVKSETGKAAPLQLYRIDKLKKQGFEAFIARSLADIHHLL